MSLPSLAPFPSASVRTHILPEEWETCLESWLLLTQRYLVLPTTIFAAQLGDEYSLVSFLTSYIASAATATASAADDPSSEKSRNLRKFSFLLVYRVLKEIKDVPPILVGWQFLSDLAIAFSKSHILKSILPEIWYQRKLGEAVCMLKSRSILTSIMEEMRDGSLLEDRLSREMALSRLCFPYAQFLMVGSDVLDSLVSALDRITSPSLRSHVMALVYMCITSLMNEQEPRTSALFDHLYNLKSTKLVKALIESTPFLAKFRSHIARHEKDSGRARPLLESFAAYDDQLKPKTLVRRRIDKGKHKPTNEYGNGTFSGVHVHKLSLVTQVQDLFPELGAGFIIKLLDEYNDDTEDLTAHLLDNDLPPHLMQADHSEIFDLSSAAQRESPHDLAPNLLPHHTPPFLPIRHNIHNNDAFDNLSINPSNLHHGRKHKPQTADTLLSQPTHPTQKAAILSALLAFDPDSDEHDDTYDAEDVGGPIIEDPSANDDNNGGSSSEAAAIQAEQNNEALLFNAYRTSPNLFNRDWDTRRAQSRQALKHDTGMTDEAIEGWAMMLARDPRRLKDLERGYETGGAGFLQRRALASTAWKGNSDAEVVDDRDAGWGARGHGGRAGFRGRGGRRGGGGGAVTGPAGEKDTQVARQRKDAHKGSRANHDRRDQRARKMARGGGGGFAG